MRRRVESDWGGGSGCRAAALLLLAGAATVVVVLYVCLPVIATGGTPAALLLVWPRRTMAGWNCICGDHNNEMAGVCAGCGRSRA